MNKLISIITVVYNAKEGLEKTIRSVLGQTYGNAEHIIIDGGSDDGTVDVIKKYQDKISYWVSEKDNGIYDAMNKGLKRANGDYVWFINAGDEIYSKETIEKVFGTTPASLPPFLRGNEADAYYGNIEYVDEEGRTYGTRTLKKPPEQLSWKNFIEGMVVSHQSIIIKREHAVEFNMKYRHAADIDWAIRSFKNCNNIVNTNLILVKFLIGGYSKRNIISSNRERYRILREHFPLTAVWAGQVRLSVKFIRYYFTHKKRLY